MSRMNARVLFPTLILALASSVAWSGPRESDSGSKPVHVGTYTRKDGAVVHGHDRAAPGAAASAVKAPARKAAPKKRALPQRSGRPSPFNPPAAVRRNARGRIQRSVSAKQSFQHSHP